MKKIFLGIASTILFFSCNNGNNKSTIQNDKEVQKLKAIEQSRIDSLEQVRVDSLALIAWGDANFGMSLKETKKSKIFKNAFISGDKNDAYQSLILFSDETNIEGMSSIAAAFFKDKLFRVDLESNEKNANYYDTDIKETVLRLKGLIENKYGKPTVEHGFPGFFEMKPDKGITAYSWQIGDKYISIDVKEVYSGSEYKVECCIFHSKEAEPAREYNRKIKEEKESKKVNGF
ncbi:MAG TPA: hypothetical protein VFC67_05200 [Prolixibacteraceae bacterium]|nr:hypothetical protein [Prolixibacteraceae bacterium]